MEHINIRWRLNPTPCHLKIIKYMVTKYPVFLNKNKLINSAGNIKNTES